MPYCILKQGLRSHIETALTNMYASKICSDPYGPEKLEYLETGYVQIEHLGSITRELFAELFTPGETHLLTRPIWFEPETVYTDVTPERFDGDPNLIRQYKNIETGNITLEHFGVATRELFEQLFEEINNG